MKPVLLLGLLVLPALVACAPRAELRELEPLPEVDAGNLAAAAQEQLAAARDELDATLDARAPAVELAARYGELAGLYQVYRLGDAARVAYRNARTLAPEDPRWPYLHGVLEQEAGEPRAAAEHFERALALRPGDAATLLRLAEVRIGLEENDRAAEYLRTALELDGAAAAAHYGLGRLAAAREDHAAAAEHFERVLALQPAATNVHYLLGLSYRRLGETEKAEHHVALFQPAEVAFPDPLYDALRGRIAGVGPLLEKALLALNDRRFDDAVAAYRAALAIEPENATALRGVGLALSQARDFEGSVAAYRRMLEIHPDHRLASVELATALLETGAVEEAVTRLEDAVAREPEFKEGHFNLGVAHSRGERWPEAEASFERVLEIDPKDERARYYLAVARAEQGRVEEAAGLLRQVIAAEPDNVLARQRLGYLLFERGEIAAAEALHREVLALDAPPPERAAAHYQLGRAAKRRGDVEAAVEHFRQALRELPDLWQARFALANTLRDAGRELEAAAEYRALSDGQPGHVPARVEEAKTLLRAGRHAEARRRLEAGLEVLPRSAELGQLYARVLATAPAAAERDGARALALASRIFDAHPSVEHAETVVMAMAAQGRFEEAVEWQRRLIDRARGEGRGAAELERLRRNLERYARGEPGVAL